MKMLNSNLNSIKNRPSSQPCYAGHEVSSVASTEHQFALYLRVLHRFIIITRHDFKKILRIKSAFGELV